MGKIKNLSDKLSKITVKDIEDKVLQIVKDKEDVITNMNTDQLFEGKKSDGSIMPPYSKTSVEVFGKPEGPIRLFDTGDFYNGFILHTEKFPILFNSKDSKTFLLVEGNGYTKGYGENIFGLTEENKKDLTENYLKEEIQNYYKSIFKL